MNKQKTILSSKTFYRFILAISFLSSQLPAYTQGLSNKELLGEHLTYSMHYGWFSLGKAEVWIDPEIYSVDDVPHFLVQCSIETSGFVQFFKPITACYQSLINMETLQPHESHRDLKFGKDIDVRTDYFSFSDSIRIHAYIQDIDEHRFHSFGIEDQILDFLSSYILIRKTDFSNEEEISSNIFYSNSLYKFQLSNQKKKNYKWDSEIYNSIEAELFFPRNEYFNKKKHGSMIFTEDFQNLPFKVQIDMTLGSFYFKLKEREFY